jgi:hypothetical protein
VQRVHHAVRMEVTPFIVYIWPGTMNREVVTVTPPFRRSAPT